MTVERRHDCDRKVQSAPEPEAAEAAAAKLKAEAEAAAEKAKEELKIAEAKKEANKVFKLAVDGLLYLSRKVE